MSDSIVGLSNSYNTSYDQYSKVTSELKKQLDEKDYSKATDEELMEACKSFESYFLEQAFKGMEKMIPKNEDSNSSNSYVEMFKDNLYQEYAKSATERGDGIGIAKMLYEQMKRNYSTDEK